MSRPGIRANRLSSIFTHRDFTSSKSRSGDRISLWATETGEKRCSSRRSGTPGSRTQVLPMLLMLRTSLDLGVERFGPGHTRRDLDGSSESEWHSEEDDSVSMNSFDFGVILPAPLCFFRSVIGVPEEFGVAPLVTVPDPVPEPMLDLGSFRGAVFPPGILLLGLGASGTGGGSFSFRVLMEFTAGRLQFVSSLFWSTFLGCFLPVLLLEGARSLQEPLLTLTDFPSGTFWLLLGLAFSRTGLSKVRVLGSGRSRMGSGLLSSVTWTSSGWEALGPRVSFWVLVRTLLWGVTMFSHLSSCHLLVDGGSG